MDYLDSNPNIDCLGLHPDFKKQTRNDLLHLNLVPTYWLIKIREKTIRF